MPTSAIVSPNLGLYYGLDPLTIPARAVKDGRQFRVKQGKIGNEKLGWTGQSALDFVEPIMLIDTFFIRGSAQKNILATTRDIFEYDLETDTAAFLNIRYDTGTVNTGGIDTYAYVMLHFNGTDASTTITDNNSPGSAHTWSVAGNAQLDTGSKKFGTASLQLDGTGDWITHADSADFYLNGGDWTIDFWFNCNKTTGSIAYLAGQQDSSGTAASRSFVIGRTAANVIEATVTASDATNATITGTTQFTDAVNTGWHHFALVRTGNVLKMFIDGVQEGGNVAFTATNVMNSSNALRVGAGGEVTTTPWLGWIDEFRISKGIARWTAAFTPYTGSYTSGNIVQGSSAIDWITAGVKAGDFLHFGAAAYRTITTSEWFQIASVDSATQLTLATAPNGQGPVAYTIRSTLLGSSADLFSAVTFVAPDDGAGGVDPDQYIFTNGVDAILSWDGSATQVTNRSTAMNFTARVLAVYKNMLMYGDVTYDGEVLPSTVINSDVGKPFLAGDAGTGLSEQHRVNDQPFPIRAMLTLSDNLAIYSTRNLTLAQFVGAVDVVFAFRSITESVGPIANRLVADYGDYHQFIGSDAMYLFDGVTCSAVNQHVWREVLRLRDATRQELGYAFFDEQNGEVYWAVPLTSDTASGTTGAPAEEAFVEHYLEEVGDKVPSPFSRRRMPFYALGDGTVINTVTWADLTGPWSEQLFRWNDSFLNSAFPLVLGGGDGTLYLLNTVSTGAGAQLPSYVITGRRVLGDGRIRGLLTRTYPFSPQFSNTLTVKARLFDHARGPLAIEDTQSFDTSLPQGGHFVTHYRRGRYFELQFGTDGDIWELGGWDTDVRPGGRR